MNRRMDMRMAGVAAPTTTSLPRAVSVLKISPHPGMNSGVLKNQSRIRIRNSRKT